MVLVRRLVFGSFAAMLLVALNWPSDTQAGIFFNRSGCAGCAGNGCAGGAGGCAGAGLGGGYGLGVRARHSNRVDRRQARRSSRQDSRHGGCAAAAACTAHASCSGAAGPPVSCDESVNPGVQPAGDSANVKANGVYYERSRSRVRVFGRLRTCGPNGCG